MRLRYNLLATTLGAALDEAATTVTFAAKLTAADGDIPTVAAPDYLSLTIGDEIVHLTAYTEGATSGTITRGEEGTTATDHTSGEAVRHTPTVEDFHDDVLRIAVWDNTLNVYPPRPAGAPVVRYIGPVQPEDWEAIDEWRLFGDPPSISPDAVASLVQWLAASDITGLSNADPVSTWPAAEGANATQGTGTNQPTFRTAVVNSEPVVRFDGSNDFMEFAALGSVLSEYTILAVVRPTTISGERTIVSQDMSGFSNDVILGVDPEGSETPNALFSGVMQKSSGSVRVVVTDPTTPSTTDFQVTGLRYDGSLFEIYRDGTPAVGSTAASGFSLADRTWNVGRNPQNQRYWSGDIAEIIIYSTALNLADLARVIAWLKQKYAL